MLGGQSLKMPSLPLRPGLHAFTLQKQPVAVVGLRAPTPSTDHNILQGCDGRGPKAHINARILQTMVSGIPLVLGL